MRNLSYFELNYFTCLSSKAVESKSEATIDMAGVTTNNNHHSSISSSFANNNSNNNRSTTVTDIEIASSSCPRIISSEGVSDGFPGEILSGNNNNMTSFSSHDNTVREKIDTYVFSKSSV